MKNAVVIIVLLTLSGCMRYQEIRKNRAPAIYLQETRSYPPDLYIKRTYIHKNADQAEPDNFRSTTITHKEPEPIPIFQIRGSEPETEDRRIIERKSIIEFERNDNSYNRLY